MLSEIKLKIQNTEIKDLSNIIIVLMIMIIKRDEIRTLIYTTNQDIYLAGTPTGIIHLTVHI